MFGFKKESVFDTRLVGVDGSIAPVTNVPGTLRLAFNWVDGQLAKGREAVRVANLVISEAKRFAGRAGENAAKRDSEIAALRAENKTLRIEIGELRDSLDQVCKDNGELSAGLGEAYGDVEDLCDALDKAEDQLDLYGGLIAFALSRAEPQAARKQKKGK